MNVSARAMARSITKAASLEKGFTLVELLVVLAIVGALSAVVSPNIGKLHNEGQSQSYAAEWHNIELAVLAMLHDSTTNALTPVAVPTADMDGVQTTDTTPLVLSDYITGLNSDGTVRTGCTYTFTADGTTAQTTP